MHYIQRLVLDNFQSHEHTETEFGPGLNVIIGPSDQGKSAIIRALRWALYNQPRGSDFVRAGTNTCRVLVVFSDGYQVLRERVKTVNRYTLTKPDGSEQIFEGFGTEVPAEVAAAHGMPEVALDRDHSVALNLGSQLEGPFLLDGTGSDRARAIGRLAGVHIIDAAMRSARKDQLQLGKDQRRLEAEVQALDQRLEAYGDLPEQEARLQQAAALLDQHDRLQARLGRLGELQVALAAADAELVQAQRLLSGLARLPSAETLVARAELAVARSSSVERVAQRWQENADSLTRGTAYLARLQQVPQAAQRAAAAEGLVQRLGRLDQTRQRWLATERDRADTERQLQQVAGVAEAAARIAGLEQAADRLVRLERVWQTWRQVTAEIAAADTQVAATTAAAGAEGHMADLQAAAQRLHALEVAAGKWQETAKSLQDGEAFLAARQEELTGYVREYERVLRHLGRCPVCGGPVGPDLIAHIAQELLGSHPAEEEGRHVG